MESETQVTGYMCLIAWEHEIDATDVKIYPSLEALRRAHPMIDQCGVAEVEVRLKSIPIPQNLTAES